VQIELTPDDPARSLPGASWDSFWVVQVELPPRGPSGTKSSSMKNTSRNVWQSHIIVLSLYHVKPIILKQMNEAIIKHYYQSQVESIDFHSEYPARIKIEGESTKTKWMDMNEVSAQIIVEKLIKEFNLKIS